MANTTTASICIEVDPAIDLANTTPSAPVHLHGNYVAFPERGSDPRAYKLHKADANWQAEGLPVATVFVTVDEHGHAHIS